MKNVDSWQPSKYTINIPKYVKGNFLDLGCGQAPLYSLYKNYAEQITCVDWGNSMHQITYLDFEQDLNQNLNMESNSFDSIILSDVLEHIRKPELLLNEIHRILNKDGVLIMNVPFFYWLHEHPFDYYRYTKYALQSMCEDAGFEILELKPYGGAPEIITDIFAKILKNIPLVGKPIAIVLQKLTWLFIKTSIGKKISNKTAQNFPFGYTLIAKK